MASTYCQVADINIRLRTTIDNASTPTDTQVEDIINKQEDFIDKYTNHAWRTTTVTDEKYDYNGSRKFFLNHRKITTFVSETDSKNARNDSNSVIIERFCIYADDMAFPKYLRKDSS